MENLSIELRILASLLGTPDMNAREAVLELADHYHWLKPAAEELETLTLTEWQAEYERLFVGDKSVTPCPPYESAYLTGPVQRPCQRTLRDLYRRVGLPLFAAPTDYLGSMLECAAHLSADAAAGRRYWSELWSGHLASWVPQFCRKLQRESKMTLYRTIAERLCKLFPEMQEHMGMAEVA